MGMKEKQMNMIAKLITDITLIGATTPVIERLVKYSADVIDMYKEGNEE